MRINPPVSTARPDTCSDAALAGGENKSPRSIRATTFCSGPDILRGGSQFDNQFALMRRPVSRGRTQTKTDPPALRKNLCVCVFCRVLPYFVGIPDEKLNLEDGQRAMAEGGGRWTVEGGGAENREKE